MRSSLSSKTRLFIGTDGGNFWMIDRFRILNLNSSARCRRTSTVLTLVVPSGQGRHSRPGFPFVLCNGRGGHRTRIDRRRVSSKGNGRPSNVQPAGSTWRLWHKMAMMCIPSLGVVRTRSTQVVCPGRRRRRRQEIAMVQCCFVLVRT